MLKSRISKFISGDRAVPLLLLLVTVASFGLLIPWLGFYWDDWPVIYMRFTQGIHGFWKFYQYDRPFSAWTYIVFSPLLGTSPLPWQLFTLLLRWLSAVFLWASLKQLWPQKGFQVLGVALLFAVFPVFTQQAVAVAYSQHWICYLLYFASIYFMLAAQTKNNKRTFLLYIALSAVMSIVEMLTMEYFFGLELLRPVFLWIYYREREAGLSALQILRRVLASGWVFITLLVGFVIWRMFFFHLAGNDPNQLVLLDSLRKAPVQALIDLCQAALQDFIYLMFAWITGINPANFDLRRPFFLLSLVVAILVPMILWILIDRYELAEKIEKQDSWPVRAVVLGVLAVLLGTLPVWLIGRQVSVGPLGNRFSLGAMMGVALVIVGFLEWLSANNKTKLAAVCILIGLAIYTNLFTAKQYQVSWERQRNFYWQMYWRAPNIQPGTAFIADGEIFPFVGLYSTSMGISLTYPPAANPEKMPHWFFSYWERLYKHPSELLTGMDLDDGIRDYLFHGSSEKALLLDYSPPSRCLHFLSMNDSDNKRLPESMYKLLSISDLSLIKPTPASNWVPPKSIFGSEPEHGWCYYFEKAELASQFENWSEVIRLMEEAKSRGFKPQDPQEYLPLLDAYLKTQKVEPALELSRQIRELTDKMNDQVCTSWYAASKSNLSSDFRSALAAIQKRFSCFD